MGLAIRLLSALRTAGAFAVRRPKDAAIILLVLLSAFLAWRMKRTEARSRELVAKLEGLPPDTKQVVTVYRDRVRVVTRDGPTRIEYRNLYIPPEGKIDLVTKVDQPDRPPEVVVKDRGFTRRLGGGLIYSGEPLPWVDAKVLYGGKYSLVFGVSPRFGGVGISRHVDDLLPSFRNLEAFGMGGLEWSGKPRLGVGVRVNF